MPQQLVVIVLERRFSCSANYACLLVVWTGFWIGIQKRPFQCKWCAFYTNISQILASYTFLATHTLFYVTYERLNWSIKGETDYLSG